MNTLTASPSAMLLPPQLPQQRTSLAALLSLLAAAAFFLFAGCATTDAPGRLLASTVQTVDAAMQSWTTYVALGHATVDQENAVRSAYTKYQAAESAAESAYIALHQTGDRTAWKIASDSLRASQTNLLALVNQFKPPNK